MRYAAIRNFDVTNGDGNGISIFVQGCNFHCYLCFNPETWNFNGGKEWTKETEDTFIKLADREYIKRISFLGGSPLCDENIKDVYNIIVRLRERFPEKYIWVYTGFVWENIYSKEYYDNYKYTTFSRPPMDANEYRNDLLQYIDILVDGKFEYENRDPNILFRGSTNQRIIDVQKSLKSGEVILWKNNQ